MRAKRNGYLVNVVLFNEAQVMNFRLMVDDLSRREGETFLRIIQDPSLCIPRGDSTALSG